MHRRKLLQITGVSLGFSVTGCLGIDPPQDTEDPPQDTESDQLENGDSGLNGNAEAAQTPDPDHSIRIKNEFSDPVDVTTTVRREPTGETVHNQTYTLQPDATVTAYNTRQANPDGIEAFNVSVTSDGSTGSVTLETDQCMGDVIAQVTESDGIDMVYSMC